MASFSTTAIVYAGHPYEEKVLSSKRSRTAFFCWPSCCRRGTSLSCPYSRCGVYSQHTGMCPLPKGLRELAAVLSGPQLKSSHVEFMQCATPRFPSFAVFSRDIGAVSV